MAELALGLTKAVVDQALSRVQLAVEEEKELWKRVQVDLSFITGEFQMMQCCLNVANKERAKRNVVVRAWVRQLRDLAFDVEDGVELVAHLDMDKSACAGLQRVVPRCLAPPRDLDDATAEMKLLKARVQDVSQRSTRYNLFMTSDDSAGSGSSVLEPNSNAITEPTTTTPNTPSLAFQVLRQVWDETGRLSCDVGSLKNLILPNARYNSDHELICLWGTNNEDTSRIIDVTINDPEIYNCFDCVKIIPASYSFDQICELEFQLDLRHLIVLEVPDLEKWNSISLEDLRRYDKMGSRIIVSTQDFGIALKCMMVPYLVSELRQYSDGHPSICAIYSERVRSLTCQEYGIHDVEEQDLQIEVLNFSDDTYMLKCQIKRGGVICVHGLGPGFFLKRFYKSILWNGGEIDGERLFDYYKWVSIRYDSTVKDFLELFDYDLANYGLYSGDFNELVDIFGRPKLQFCYRWKAESLVKMRPRILCPPNKFLLVIEGWLPVEVRDYIKSTILRCMHPNSCVVVTANDKSEAEYIVDGQKDRLVYTTSSLKFKKEQACTLSGRSEEAMTWMRSFFDDNKGSVLAKRLRSYNAQICRCTDIDVHTGEFRNDDNISHRPPVTSVWGMPGVGKSALVRWFYYDRLIIWTSGDQYYRRAQHNLYCYCWVDVPHPYSLAELSWRLLLEIHSNFSPNDTVAAMVASLQGQDPIQQCCKLLREQDRLLLVLDGLESTDEWDSINTAFCLSALTDRIQTIVITNQKSVAMHCVDNNKHQMVSVQGLESAGAHHLFTKKSRKHILRDIDELKKSIVPMCGGFPKLITDIAEHLEKKTHYLEWEHIKEHFMETLEGFHSLRGLFSWMQSYLETCKDELKPCIFYLTVFPMGHKIRRRRLLRRWIAEGYSRDTFSHTAVENAETLFSELLELSIIQRQPSKQSLCLVNGFFREYITSRQIEDNLCFALEGSCSLNSQRVGQHLTISKNWDRQDKIVFERTDFSRLRSLTIFGDCMPFMFDPDKIMMRRVRVLDLEDASGVNDVHLEQIVGLLPRLKFLSIRGCRDVTRLPKSLGGLRQLQTLDVRDTSVTTLPEAILKLQYLQYVRAGTVHSPPWDEGGIMVTCEETTPEDNDYTSGIQEEATSISAAQDGMTAAVVTMAESEDGTTVAAVPAPPEDDATAVEAAAISAPVEDATTVAPAPPEDATTAAVLPVAQTEGVTTIVAASMASVEDATMAAVVPAAPPQEASTVSRAPPENSTTVSVVPSTPAQVSTAAPAPASAPGSRPHALVASWLSKFRCRRNRPGHTGGVQVPAGGMGNLTILHTFGVAHVGPGKSVSRMELHKLTQLHKLSVCGINVDNISEFFSAIKDLNHLKSLSVRVDYNKDGRLASLDSTISRPPKSVESLKLHGHVRILQGSWFTHIITHIKKLDLEVTIKGQEDMNLIINDLKAFSWSFMERLCIKPIHNGTLDFSMWEESRFRIDVLEIVCTSDLEVTIMGYVRMLKLKVHCSSGSSLRLHLRGIRGLFNEVWLKGSYSDELKQDLQRQIAKLRKPVLKVLQSSP